MTSSTDLAALLCSRLCHDMLSPVGALNNGLELLADERDPAMRENVMELLEQSARTSADKLKFFSLAFGAAGGFGDMVDSHEPKALIDALAAANKRLEVNWALSDARLPKPAVKVEEFSRNGVEKVLFFSAAISADAMHSQYDVPALVNKARVPAGFSLVNLGAWNDDPIVIQAIKEKIDALMN